MSIELQKSPLIRVHELLGCGAEVSQFDLLDQLRAARNEWHPDRFHDEGAKRTAEERFKEVQVLVLEVERLIEADKLNRKPSEIVLYRSQYDVVALRRELDGVKAECESLKSELQRERQQRDDDKAQINALESLLKKKEGDQLAEDIKHLQKIYQPTVRGFASLGLAFLFSGIVTIATQIEKVSGVLEKYSPFDGAYIRTGVFIILLLLLLGVARKLIESKYIERRSEEICGPRFAEDFLADLSGSTTSTGPVREFSEVQAFRFVAGEANWWRRLSIFAGFSIFREQTGNRLKDIFLHNLLNKRLIEFARAEKMQRYFKIADTQSSNFWYEQYRKERAKNEGVAVAEDL